MYVEPPKGRANTLWSKWRLPAEQLRQTSRTSISGFGPTGTLTLCVREREEILCVSMYGGKVLCDLTSSKHYHFLLEANHRWLQCWLSVLSSLFSLSLFIVADSPLL